MKLFKDIVNNNVDCKDRNFEELKKRIVRIYKYSCRAERIARAMAKS